MTVEERDAIEGALYQLGIVTDILTIVAKANITGDGLVICGCLVDWLAARQREQHERIEAAVSDMWRGAA